MELVVKLVGRNVSPTKWFRKQRIWLYFDIPPKVSRFWNSKITLLHCTLWSFMNFIPVIKQYNQMKCSNFYGFKETTEVILWKFCIFLRLTFLPNVIKIEEINEYFFYFLGKNPESKVVKINIMQYTVYCCSIASIFKKGHSIKGEGTFINDVPY